jgi:hypothetical protein
MRQTVGSSAVNRRVWTESRKRPRFPYLLARLSLQAGLFTHVACGQICPVIGATLCFEARWKVILLSRWTQYRIKTDTSYTLVGKGLNAIQFSATSYNESKHSRAGDASHSSGEGHSRNVWLRGSDYKKCSNCKEVPYCLPTYQFASLRREIRFTRVLTSERVHMRISSWTLFTYVHASLELARGHLSQWEKVTCCTRNINECQA